MKESYDARIVELRAEMKEHYDAGIAELRAELTEKIECRDAQIEALEEKVSVIQDEGPQRKKQRTEQTKIDD